MKEEVGGLLQDKSLVPLSLNGLHLAVCLHTEVEVNWMNCTDNVEGSLVEKGWCKVEVEVEKRVLTSPWLLRALAVQYEETVPGESQVKTGPP